MALAWNLREPALACALIGASRPQQVIDNVRALDHLDFSDEELAQIEQILGEQTPIDWSTR